MRNFIVVFVVILIGLSGCNILGPDIDTATVNFSVVMDSSGPMMSARSVDADTYPEGSVSGGLEMTFIAQQVEFWSTQWALDSNNIPDPVWDDGRTLPAPNGGFTNDPIYNLYSEDLYADLNNEDPETWPWYWEAWFRGPVSAGIRTTERYTFSSGDVNAVPPVEVLFGSTVYDVVRIAIEEIRYYHNDDNITRIYNNQTNDWGALDEFDSIFLISNNYISEPYFIPNTDFGMTYEELETKHGEFYASFLTENRGHIVMDGAIFLPFGGLDLTNLNVNDVVVTIDWDIDNSISVQFFEAGVVGEGVIAGNQFVYNERISGTGVPFDFGVSSNVY